MTEDNVSHRLITWLLLLARKLCHFFMVVTYFLKNLKFPASFFVDTYSSAESTPLENFSSLS